MNNQKHVVLLAGGLSKEAPVSKMSAESVYKSLVSLGYRVTVVDPDRHIARTLVELKPDVVFNCLHGTFGEDGAIPGVLEVLGIPYTHSGITASSVAMDKVLTKKIAISCGIKTPKYLHLNQAQLFSALESSHDPMPKPYVIKPAQQGSTIGIYLILDDKSKQPKRSEWLFGDSILIEEYIPGQELSAPVWRGEALGILELRPKTGFYDYDAKYKDGLTDHIYPAEIPQEVYKTALDCAAKIHNTLGCRTVSRSDFRYNSAIGNADGLFFLELNTHPGFTSLSIVPEVAAKSKGLTMDQLVEQLIEDARCEIAP